MLRGEPRSRASSQKLPCCTLSVGGWPPPWLAHVGRALAISLSFCAESRLSSQSPARPFSPSQAFHLFQALGRKAPSLRPSLEATWLMWSRWVCMVPWEAFRASATSCMVPDDWNPHAACWTPGGPGFSSRSAQSAGVAGDRLGVPRCLPRVRVAVPSGSYSLSPQGSLTVSPEQSPGTAKAGRFSPAEQVEL